MLFFRELKKIVWSVSYLLFVAILTLALFSQGVLNFSDETMTEPQQNGDYGIKQENLPQIIMPAAVESLYGEFLANSYKTYPIGFYKNVKLKDTEQKSAAAILSSLTGTDENTLYQAQQDADSRGNGEFTVGGDPAQSDANGGLVMSGGDAPGIPAEDGIPTVRRGLSYDEFKEHMQRMDDLLGGGSKYAAESLIKFGMVPVTYEEAHENYELAKNYDKVTGGYARLFSDYAVTMVLSILPVFLAVILSMKDKRAKMSELIYTRRISGVKLMFIRYAAILTAVMLPVILLSYISNASVWSSYSGTALDYWAPLKYDAGYILPSVMISAAVGLCLTELTGTSIAVAVQGFWWFLDINMGYQSVEASYSLFRLAPRHNAGLQSFFRTQDFIDHFDALLANRLLFAGISLLLVAAAAAIFNAKRKGQLNGHSKTKKAFAGIRHRQNQSEA